MRQRQGGAILVDGLEIPNLEAIVSMHGGEEIALRAELKLSLNAYLKDLVTSPVRSLADVIAFNEKFSDLVSIISIVFFFCFLLISRRYTLILALVYGVHVTYFVIQICHELCVFPHDA